MPDILPYTEGQAALRSGHWSQARHCFEAALEVENGPEIHDGLGIALWWLNEVRASHGHRTRAYLGYRQQGNLPRAAVVAAWLAREQVFLDGNGSAMNGWFARAERLLRQCGPCVEASWVALFRASVTAPPEELARVADAALNGAQQFNDPDLEVMALAFKGLAMVSLGQVREGMTQLDEAMAAATAGEATNFMVVSETFCVTLSACDVAGDLVRMEHWCQAAAAYAEQYGCPFLSAYCRTTYGGLLLTSGRWHEAEIALTEAIRAFEQGHRALRIHAVLKLADLRVCQGRLEEAEALLSGYEDHGAAVVPLARYHLAQGQAHLARSVLEQALGGSGAPALHQLPLLQLLAQVLLLTGDRQAAEQITDAVNSLAQQTSSDFLLAQAALAQGHLKLQSGEVGATYYLQVALDHLRRYEQSLLAGRVKLEMAQALKEQDSAGAKTWARAALATFERIGAGRESDEAAKLLRELGGPGNIGARKQELLTQREREVLSLLAHGLTNREIAERLVITIKTVEHHVSQILGKLGFRSRAEAAAYVASRGAVSLEGTPLSKD